jgi:uncharacterized protein YndB with AHSA1/START domain
MNSDREERAVEAIRHDFSTPATAEAVYNALATSAGIKGWWAKVGTVAEAVGGTTELRFDKDGQIVAMQFQVDQLEPRRRVRWTCVENANPLWKGTTLTWTIADAGDRRKVSFVHDGFSAGGPPYDMTVEGWKHFNASFESYLDGRGGMPSN